MLLALPGDNTYANYQEANRACWRQTVLPLATRIAAGLTSWLAQSTNPALSLRPDLDQAEALSPEREALWTRLDAATFLTPNEKRAAAGYDPIAEGGDSLAAKFNNLHDARGRFDFKPDDDLFVPVASKPGGKQPVVVPPAPKPGDPAKQFKKPKSGQSGKESSNDVPDFARGNRPYVGESGDQFAKRILDQQFPNDIGNHKTGPNSDYSIIKKWGERHFD